MSVKLLDSPTDPPAAVKPSPERKRVHVAFNVDKAAAAHWRELLESCGYKPFAPFRTIIEGAARFGIGRNGPDDRDVFVEYLHFTMWRAFNCVRNDRDRDLAVVRLLRAFESLDTDYLASLAAAVESRIQQYENGKQALRPEAPTMPAMLKIVRDDELAPSEGGKAVRS